ncbi:MAG TPA: response regulator, partial [Leptospiraceae bacterium]|nr:response regulator [Leptospiraceae bacterium]
YLLKAYTLERQKSRILEGLHILVAEDNELNQKLVTKYLTGQGASVKLALNGIKCLELLNTARFDLILMDLQMPEMDGYEASKTIRNSYRIPIPIIACTADTMAGEKEKCFQAGMNGYISKPYSEDELINAILSVCSVQ